MSTTIESRDRLIDILSLSYLGDLLREQLGDDAENYTFPDDFEKAVADIGFRALSVVGEPPVFGKLVCIGDGLVLLPRHSINGDAAADYETVQFIAPTLTEVPPRAFMRCIHLERITIPDSVTSIGSSAFYGCTGLQSVVIPDSVTSIGSSAFMRCTGLTGAVAMNGLATYNGSNNSGAFHSCQSMTSFSAPKVASITSGTSAQHGLFYGCSGMTVCNLGSVGYPVTSIQNVTFSGCTNTSLVVTVYTNSQNVASILANVRNGATNATIIIKAAADMEYNGVTYSAGDTVLTSTP